MTDATEVAAAASNRDPAIGLSAVASLRELLESHRDWTESPVAERLLESWAESRNRFTVVLPRDYQRVLDVRTAAEAEGLDLDGAEVWERIMEASRG